jgi:hypothetical protein
MVEEKSNSLTPAENIKYTIRSININLGKEATALSENKLLILKKFAPIGCPEKDVEDATQPIFSRTDGYDIFSIGLQSYALTPYSINHASERHIIAYCQGHENEICEKCPLRQVGMRIPKDDKITENVYASLYKR